MTHIDVDRLREGVSVEDVMRSMPGYIYFYSSRKEGKFGRLSEEERHQKKGARALYKKK
jgi:hypothetical protein